VKKAVTGLLDAGPHELRIELDQDLSVVVAGDW
jgi:hypothetical protein